MISLDEKFAKLEVELKGSSVPDSKLEIVSSSDLMPLNKRSIGGVIFRDENIPGRPWRMAIQYGIKSVGKNASGPIWVKLYFENEGLFSGSSSSDEPGFMSQVILPATSWNNDFAGTYGNVPGSGFYVPVNSNITVVANEIKPMKMRMLIKVYYGLQEALVQ